MGVMGPGNQATPADIKTAYALGNAIARAGWVLLTGGRNVGVMDAASRGAKHAQGLTIGILPDDHRDQMSSAVDIPILTGLGPARNVVNVLISHVIVACGNGAGTASEIALAIKTGKPLIIMTTSPEALAFWQTLSTAPLGVAPTVGRAIAMIEDVLASKHP